MKTVLIDVHGVVCDFRGAFLRIAREVLHRDLFEVEADEWDVGKAHGLKDVEQHLVYQVFRSPGFAYTELRPYEGAVAGIEELRRRTDVCFVTAPMRSSVVGTELWNPRFMPSMPETLTWMHDTEHWLFKHFGIDEDHVIHTSAKHRIGGDIFIDDMPRNVRNWKLHHPNGTGMLWHQTYNRSELIHRAFDWASVLRSIS